MCITSCPHFFSPVVHNSVSGSILNSNAKLNVVSSGTKRTTITSWNHCCFILPHWFTERLKPLSLKAKLCSTRAAEVSVFPTSPLKKLKQGAWDQYSIACIILVNYFWNNARYETTNCPPFWPFWMPKNQFLKFHTSKFCWNPSWNCVGSFLSLFTLLTVKKKNTNKTPTNFLFFV